MKKLFLLSCLLMMALASGAQNVQFHYDLGRSLYSNEEATRQKATVTFEQFKADATGSWFWFIDLDMYQDGMKGAYTEISREFTFAPTSANTSLAAHIEYNGGSTTFKQGGGGTRYQNAALAGVALNGHNADFSTTWSVQALYKRFFKQGGSKAYNSFQLTGVWGVNFAGGKGTFSGFLDFWREETFSGHGKMVLLSEPQIWYNVDKHLSFGSEVEISNNFIFPECITEKSFYVNPTIAVKYNF